MKKYAWIWIVIIIIFLMIVAFSIGQNSNNLTQPVATASDNSSQSQVTKQSITPPTTDNTTKNMNPVSDAQNNCTLQNWESIVEVNNPNTVEANSQFSIHYNSTLGKCFVEITSVDPATSNNDYVSSTYDAIADTSGVNTPEILFRDTWDSLSSGQGGYAATKSPAGVVPISNDEFGTLRQEYMEN